MKPIEGITNREPYKLKMSETAVPTLDIYFFLKSLYFIIIL